MLHSQSRCQRPIIWSHSIIPICSITKSQTQLNTAITTCNSIGKGYAKSIQLRQVLPHSALAPPSSKPKLRLQITYNCYPVKVKNSHFGTATDCRVALFLPSPMIRPSNHPNRNQHNCKLNCCYKPSSSSHTGPIYIPNSENRFSKQIPANGTAATDRFIGPGAPPTATNRNYEAVACVVCIAT